MFARDIMTTGFHMLRPDNSIAEAVKMFQTASLEEQKRVFGLMVIDEKGHLAGMLSMYDVLLFVQPKHVHLWDEMDGSQAQARFDELLERVKPVRVADIMTVDVVTVSPQTHIVVIADLMIKRHVRRLPVVEGEDVVGIVYISDLFYHILNKFL